MLFRRPFAVLAIVTLFSVGCQREVNPDSISASVVAFGEYRQGDSGFDLFRETATINCAEGKIFGVDYRIEVRDGERGTLPVEFRWLHPELAVPSRRLWGTETRADPSKTSLGWRESVLQGRVLWRLDHPDELVSGLYEFRIRRSDDGRPILSQAFDVEGC